MFSGGKNKLETCQALSKDLYSAQDWAVTWGMLFNADKSEWLQTTSKHTAAQDDNWDSASYNEGTGNSSSQGTQSLRVAKVTSTLSWSEHISRMRAKCAQRVGRIRKIRHLPNHVLKRIYLAQVRSTVEYGCAVWSGDNISMLQKLQDCFCWENHVKLPPVQARLNWVFTDILAGFTFNNRVLRLPAIVLLNTTFRPGNSGLLRVYVQAF